MTVEDGKCATSTHDIDRLTPQQMENMAKALRALQRRLEAHQAEHSPRPRRQMPVRP